jgi:hypothetical protein
MMKSITALAIFGLLGVAVVVLPDVAPEVKASETITLAKGDQSIIRPIARNCLQQVWPNFDASCLRGTEPDVMIGEARLVTARR